MISKTGSEKKRVVYTYPEPENTVLKLLTYLMLRKYDGVFSPCLFSFRPGKNAKDAVKAVLRYGKIYDLYAYKVDIHDYFNSVPVDSILPVLKTVLFDDSKLYVFLSSLLREPLVSWRGSFTEERKGIMAGTPLSSFYANLYLKDLDFYFFSRKIIYSRYSDDIIVFSETEQDLLEYAAYIQDFLERKQLSVNEKKEFVYRPGEGFTFLGFSCRDSVVDIAPVTVNKLKQKMRRKRDSLLRWYLRNDLEPEKAAKAFIRIFNRKLLESPRDNELSWSSWFFPVINTADSLHEIDLYAQDCIRYLISGRHTKSRFNVRYEHMKALGYRSLVNEFYSHRKHTEK
ncbi:MAG: group II intron reverse transcriptase domain-containing protein [Clostridia bacterium]|nr:group II intron reverse transcriptase domain-containing protein [Clostridia bacterium]